MAPFWYKTIRLARSIQVKSQVLVVKIRNNSSTMDIIDCFTGIKDSHNGITVDSTKEPCSPDRLVQRLQTSLSEWINANKKTVWFRVDRSNANWIPLLVNEGFYFHHAKEEYVVLYKCLTSDKNIPPYAHTNIGIGAMVINEATNEILVIQEKYSDRRANKNSWWKLPGGYVEPGETLPKAIEREVLEETGITGKFKALIGFRHAHNYAFGCSDIYFIARLIPETFEITKSDQEISECTWMKLEDYANHPEVHKLNRFIAKKMIETLENHVEIGLIHAQRPNSTEPIWIYTITNNNEVNPKITN